MKRIAFLTLLAASICHSAAGEDTNHRTMTFVQSHLNNLSAGRIAEAAAHIAPRVAAEGARQRDGVTAVDHRRLEDTYVNSQSEVKRSTRLGKSHSAVLATVTHADGDVSDSVYIVRENEAGEMEIVGETDLITYCLDVKSPLCTQ